MYIMYRLIPGTQSLHVSSSLVGLSVRGLCTPAVTNCLCCLSTRHMCQSSPVVPSRGRVREYHYVLKMTSRHFQHVLFFTTDIFSTCCLTTVSARTVVTFQHEAIWLVLRLHFQHGAIWLVLPTTFSARSHLIGPPDYIFSTKPFDWNSFCTDTSDWWAVLWFSARSIFVGWHSLQRTTIIQVASSNSSDILPTVRGTPFNLYGEGYVFSVIKKIIYFS